MSEEFIREVDEDLRHKQLTGLWRRFGPFVIAFLVGVVLFVAGNVTLKNYNEGKYREVADIYSKVEENMAANDMAGALDAIKALSDTDIAGYQILTAFKEADIHLQQNNPEAAVAALDRLAAASGVDKVYRDLARLKAAMIAVDAAPYEESKARLAPLTVADNAWKYMAKELLAMAALKSGNSEEARRILTELAQDLEAPDDVKVRARDFKSIIE